MHKTCEFNGSKNLNGDVNPCVKFKFCCAHVSVAMKKIVSKQLSLGLSIPKWWINITSTWRMRWMAQKAQVMIYSFMNIEHWNVCNIVGKLMKEIFQLHVNDVMNVKLWVQNTPYLVFFYHETHVEFHEHLIGCNLPFGCNHISTSQI